MGTGLAASGMNSNVAISPEAKAFYLADGLKPRLPWRIGNLLHLPRSATPPLNNAPLGHVDWDY
jgi:hypothetical protein